MLWGDLSGSCHVCQTALEICQDFGIVGSYGHLLEQRLHGLQPSLLAQVREHRDDCAIGLFVVEQCFAASAGECDSESWEDAPFGQLVIEPQLPIAGSLELLVDRVIHAAACVH